MTVTLRNLGADPVSLWAPGGLPGSFGVDGDGTVDVPGVVLADEGDHYLIGPEGTEWGDDEDVPDAVRAWPKANWAVENGGGDKQEGDDDA